MEMCVSFGTLYIKENKAALAGFTPIGWEYRWDASLFLLRLILHSSRST